MMMEIEDINAPSRWVKLLYYLWKIFTCLFLHLLLIAIVVGYCFFGSYMFEKLEQQYEKDMKMNITYIRGNVTKDIWAFTKQLDVLNHTNWTNKVREDLKNFEGKLVWAMRKGGWNGNETADSLQWTSGGALFYSIIVITTIGYGHIAPKTPQGKIATIFYAVVGIPLMLLCLSNIGDVMAHSFRFIYWRICCYKCTQPPKRIPPFPPSRRARSFRSTVRSHGNRFSGRSRTTSFRHSGRNSQKSADSAIGMSETYTRSSHSDTECRYYDEMEQDNAIPNEKFFNRQSQQSRYSDNVTMYQTPRHSQHSSYKSRMAMDPILAECGEYTRNSPVVFNKYALEREESCRLSRSRDDGKYRQGRRDMSKNDSVGGSRRLLAPTGIATLPRATNEYPPPRFRRERPRSTSSLGRHNKENIGPSPRIMSPLGFAVHRQTFPRAARDYQYDDYYDYYMDYYDYYQHDYTRPVPIWLCVFLVVSYIIGGAFLFNEQQHDWGLFNSAYFCFITLTTIGFGDFVPEQKVGTDAKLGTAICSLYLLFGIALLAMSFNLVQEEVINNVKSVARHLGIIKDEDSDE
ncbi:uncharacterized protein galene [Planococcus citri]|uniref:uncharacterized protein galene n=1 Tax=Planococcus citri TaxID=170843 RepID=UPI0031F72DA4